MVTRLLTMLLTGPDLHCAGPLALWRFWQNLLAKKGEDQKNSYHLSAGSLALCHRVNPVVVIALHS